MLVFVIFLVVCFMVALRCHLVYEKYTDTCGSVAIILACGLALSIVLAIICTTITNVAEYNVKAISKQAALQ